MLTLTSSPLSHRERRPPAWRPLVVTSRPYYKYLRSKHTGATVNWGPELQPFSLYNYFHEDVKNKKNTLLSAIIPQGCPSLVGLGSPPFWNDAGPQHRCLALCSPSPRTHSLEETLPVLKHIHPRAGVHTDSLLPCLVLWRKVSKLSNSLTWTHEGASTEAAWEAASLLSPPPRHSRPCQLPLPRPKRLPHSISSKCPRPGRETFLSFQVQPRRVSSAEYFPGGRGVMWMEEEP